MAKKTKKDSYQGDPGDEHVEKVITKQPKVDVKVVEKPLSKKDNWEIKDRTYLVSKGKPLSKSIKSAGIYW